MLGVVALVGGGGKFTKKKNCRGPSIVFSSHEIFVYETLVRYFFTFPLPRAPPERALRSARKAVSEGIVFEWLQQKC